MKKTLFTILFVALAAVSASAQNMFVKPMVGGTLSTLTGDVENAKMRFGVVGGAEFGYMLSPEFAVTAGVLASMQGANQKEYTEVIDGQSFSVKDGSVTLTYLNVPILANYYVAPGLAIKAGVQPGFLLSRKSKVTYALGNMEEKVEDTSTDGMKKFDLSIPLGLSYEFDDFVIDARYNLGLTNINDSDAGKVKNGVIMLTVGYKIPL